MKSLISTNGLSNLFSDLDNFWGNHIWDSPHYEMTNYPRTDIIRENGEYKISMDLPGITKDDINISLEDGILEISSSQKSEKDEEDGKHYLRRERTYRTFSRRFKLNGVKDDAINATLENGVLNISIPEEEKKTKRIEIK